MKRLKVVYRESASADLLAVFDWVLERFVGRILSACERIGDAPLGGRPRDDLHHGLRTFAFERKAVIAYLPRGDRVEIVKIFYGGRDIDAFFRVSPRSEG